MADKKVGIKTDRQTQAGKDVYVTPEGENVSEKSTTFKYKGMWINIPSIYKGQQYDDETLKLMLEAEIIKPTSTHRNKKAAEEAAQKRSDTLKFNKGGDVAFQMDSMLPKKGMSYGELIVDNILGLDNDYESFGEKLGKAVDEDELGFLKDAAVGVYEGAKEFITNPVETTKEVVTNIKDSVQRLGTEDLDTRLKNMYSVDYTQATDEQVNAAREAVIGDALTAMELIPAAKVTVSAAKAGSAAVPSGVKADVVGQTKALLSGDTEFLKGTPTERSGTVGVGAEVVGQDDVSLDDITDYMDSEVQPTKSKKETNPLVRSVNASNVEVQADLADFRSSVLGSLDNLAIGKDGMSGFQIKKFLEKRAPKINKTELYWSGLLENLDDNKKYSRVGLENIVDRNVPKVDIEVLDGSQVRYRGTQRVALNVNNNIMQPLDGYKEIILVNRNTKGTEYSAGHYDIMFQPDGNVLAHVRGSFVENNEPDFPIKEKFFLVEELQSDAVQQHTVADKAITKKIKEEKTSKPTLGDIGLHYQIEFNDMIFPYHAGGLEFTDKFVKDINRYNYNFRSIGDQDTAEQAISLGLTKIIDDMAKLKSGFVDGNRNKDAIAFLLSREYGLKENSIKRRSIEELDEVDNIFANVLGDYVFGKTAVRKFNKENDNEFKEDLINIFKGINITAGLEKDLVPAKLSDTIRMSLLAVIRESKSEGVNKIYIPTPKVMSEAHSLSLEASYQTYYKGVTKVLRGLKKETNNKIKYSYKNPEDISYYNDPKSVGIEIDITDFDLPDNPQFRFAERGVVKDMDNQMKMAFMNEGGLKDDGMKRDPVSGNEVPNGSMASEVRDDIPAQLSEGEYVVPADVVRYLGVKHFEDLRNKAKSGLQNMEANGRIGGEPVPVGGPKAAPMPQPPIPYMAEGGDLTPDEMNEIKMLMNQGGMVMGAVDGTDVSPYSNISPYSSSPPKFTGGFSWEQNVEDKTTTDPKLPTESKTLYGPNGEVVTLTLPKDQQKYDALIAQGYTETQPVTPTVRSGDDSSSTPPPPTVGTQTEGAFGFGTFGQGVDWTDTEQAIKFIDGKYTPIDPKTRKAVVGAGMIIGGPLALLTGAITTYDALEDLSKLRATAITAKAYGNTAAAEYAESKIAEYEAQTPDLVSGSFGDWLAPGTARAAGGFKGKGYNISGDMEDWDDPDQQKELQRLRDDAKKKKPVTLAVDKNKVAGMPSGPMGFDPKGGGLEEAKRIKEQRERESSGDGPSLTQIVAARAQTPTAKASTGTKTTEEARAATASAVQKYGRATGGRATGGLVSRPKKKKNK